jgi:TRAP-type C4-dicarboxylate transport system permease large subunit
MGVVATLIIIFFRKELTWFLFKDALVRTFKASGTILTITFGATTLAGAYSLAGGPTYVAETILAYDLKPMYLIFMMQIMFLILGAFMDWVGNCFISNACIFTYSFSARFRSYLVWNIILCKHAGIFFKPTIWTSRFLFKICYSTTYFIDRYF